MTVNGNIWTRTSRVQRRSGGIANTRTTYTFVSPDEHVAQYEISIDKSALWTVVFDAAGRNKAMTFTRNRCQPFATEIHDACGLVYRVKSLLYRPEGLLHVAAVSLCQSLVFSA